MATNGREREKTMSKLETDLYHVITPEGGRYVYQADEHKEAYEHARQQPGTKLYFVTCIEAEREDITGELFPEA